MIQHENAAITHKLEPHSPTHLTQKKCPKKGLKFPQGPKSRMPFLSKSTYKPDSIWFRRWGCWVVSFPNDDESHSSQGVQSTTWVAARYLQYIHPDKKRKQLPRSFTPCWYFLLCQVVVARMMAWNRSHPSCTKGTFCILLPGTKGLFLKDSLCELARPSMRSDPLWLCKGLKDSVQPKLHALFFRWKSVKNRTLHLCTYGWIPHKNAGLHSRKLTGTLRKDDLERGSSLFNYPDFLMSMFRCFWAI